MDHDEYIETMQKAINYTAARVANLQKTGDESLIEIYESFLEHLKEKLRQLEAQGNSQGDRRDQEDPSIAKTSPRRTPAKRRKKAEQRVAS